MHDFQFYIRCVLDVFSGEQAHRPSCQLRGGGGWGQPGAFGGRRRLHVREAAFGLDQRAEASPCLAGGSIGVDVFPLKEASLSCCWFFVRVLVLFMCQTLQRTTCLLTCQGLVRKGDALAELRPREANGLDTAELTEAEVKALSESMLEQVEPWQSHTLTPLGGA